MTTNASNIKPITIILRERFKLILLISIIYALAYIHIVGIILYLPSPLEFVNYVPFIRVTSYGIVFIPTKTIYIFAFWHAIAFIMVTSLLIGINIVLLLRYRWLIKSSCCRVDHNNKNRSNNRKEDSIKGMPSVISCMIPAFFTSFSCCGGGLLALAIGPIAFSYLTIYGVYIAILTIAMLLTSTYMLSRSISMVIKNASA